jgi:hypothetical protein
MSTTKVSSAASSNPDIPVATTTRNGEVYQEVVQGLVNQPHDEIALTYTGSDLTGVVYKLGGVTVATLTLGYTGGNLSSVVRS